MGSSEAMLREELREMARGKPWWGSECSATRWATFSKALPVPECSIHFVISFRGRLWLWSTRYAMLPCTGRGRETEREESAFWIDAPMVVHPHPQLAQTVSSRQHHFVRRCSRGKCSARPRIVAKCRACVRDMETRSLARSACGFNAVPPRLAGSLLILSPELSWLASQKFKSLFHLPCVPACIEPRSPARPLLPPLRGSTSPLASHSLARCSLEFRAERENGLTKPRDAFNGLFY